jgi:hypothetical protein
MLVSLAMLHLPEETGDICVEESERSRGVVVQHGRVYFLIVIVRVVLGFVREPIIFRRLPPWNAVTCTLWNAQKRPCSCVRMCLRV